MKQKIIGYVPGMLKNLLLYTGVFTAVVVSLYLLMVLFATIPNQAISENMKSSVYYELPLDRYEIPDNGSFQRVADNFADQVWLSIAWDMGNGDPFYSVLDTDYYNGESFGTAVGLHHAVFLGYDANESYNRYWHGSAALLRFLHIWTDIQGSKILGIICVLFLILITVRLLFRNGHADLGMCLLASLLAVQILQVRLSFEYLPCFLLCFSFCPAFLKLEKAGDTPLAVLSVAAGVTTAFFDFLTVETITILIPIILVVAVRSMDKRLVSKKDTAVLLLRCLLCWGLAYIGTFATKWIAVVQVTGENHFSEALSSAQERMNGMVLVNGKERNPGLFLAIGANLSVLFGGIDRFSYGKVLVGLLLCAIAVYMLIREYWIKHPVSRGTGFILTLGALVLVRYGVLANHSYLHAFFTYRAFLSTILAVLTALMLNLRPQKKRRRPR